jgi:RHS repeat-associated protein
VGPISEHTNARPHCSFQLGTTTQYGTTWLSVASSTDETGTVVQTLDYYPYGALRISSATSTNEKRKFIGQFSDDSGLSYLQARYYNPNQGQFISEDPSFLSVGDPNQVQQVTGRDQQTFLADPQLANSYNYGRDNPITNKDPQGNIGAAAAIPFLAPEATVATIFAPEVVIPAAVIGSAAFVGYQALLRTSNGLKYGGQFDPKRLPPTSMMGPDNISDPFGGGPPNIDPKIPKWIVGTVAAGIGAQLGTEILEAYVKQLDFTKRFNERLQNQPKGLQQGSNQSNPSRQSAGQSGNSSLQSLLGQLSAVLSKLGQALSDKKSVR